MTAETTETTRVNDDMNTSTGRSTYARRDVLRIGGVTVTVAALLAACGNESAEGPLARIGDAPTTTGLPDAPVTDAVLLRTLASVELSVAELYDTLADDGRFSGPAAEAVSRFTQDHRANATAISRLVQAEGATGWDCTNPRFDQVVVEPILQRINGGTDEEGTAIPPSDDPDRDALATVHAMESLLASSHQSFIPQLHDPALREQVITFGEQDARHAAVAALIINPEEPTPPAASPAAEGGAEAGTTTTTEVPETPAGVPEAPGQGAEAPTTTTTATGTTPFTPVHAIPGEFGNLAQLQLVVGAANESGTRYTANLETPSLNSYIYDHLECDA